MESEKEEEDSDGEMESRISRPEHMPSGGQESVCAAPTMTKEEARKLRRLKKLDHSWMKGLLDK